MSCKIVGSGQPGLRYFLEFAIYSLYHIASPILSRAQILSAIRSASRKLERAHTRAEFMRLTGIHYCKLIPHFPGGYREAIRAAGLSPHPGGVRIDTAAMLTDWAPLTRKKGRIPTRGEYEREGHYAAASLETRFHRWSQLPAVFLKFTESSGLSKQWSAVVRFIHHGPMPTRGGGRRWLKGWQKSKPQASLTAKSLAARRTTVSPISILPPLQGKKCVTLAMLHLFFQPPSLRPLIPRRVLPDRPLLGPPLDLPGFVYEPANEMGVILLFGMLALRLGFIIESAQLGYPDCQAKLEVEPGRWQHVRIEFEYESRHFRAHRHDALLCDIIVCWRHNWTAVRRIYR
jgi:hypothetical protein